MSKIPQEQYDAFHLQGYAAADGAEYDRATPEIEKMRLNPHDRDTPEREAWNDGWDDFHKENNKD